MSGNSQKSRLKALSASDVKADTLAGEPILQKLTHAPGNDAAIGGLKVVTENGWFAARPSGTEDIYKIYLESFKGEEHLALLEKEAIIAETVRTSGVTWIQNIKEFGIPDDCFNPIKNFFFPLIIKSFLSFLDKPIVLKLIFLFKFFGILKNNKLKKAINLLQNIKIIFFGDFKFLIIL